MLVDKIGGSVVVTVVYTHLEASCGLAETGELGEEGMVVVAVHHGGGSRCGVRLGLYQTASNRLMGAGNERDGET